MDRRKRVTYIDLLSYLLKGPRKRLKKRALKFTNRFKIKPITDPQEVKAACDNFLEYVKKLEKVIN